MPSSKKVQLKCGHVIHTDVPVRDPFKRDTSEFCVACDKWVGVRKEIHPYEGRR